ncbi:MAG TPA: hypothetical protein VGD78_22435 [Chthoniobacterales bacterium]
MLAAVALSSKASEQAAKRLHVPVLTPFDYKKTTRDPFLDPAVLVTLLGAKKQDIAMRPPPIDNYAGELQQLLNSQYSIQGIAYDPQTPMALMSGRAVKVGGRIVLKIGGEGAVAAAPAPGGAPPGATAPLTLQDRLYATSRYWGLDLENDLRQGRLRLNVQSISPSTVRVKLPAASQAFVLAYGKSFDPVADNAASSYGAAPGGGSAHPPPVTTPKAEVPKAGTPNAVTTTPVAASKPVPTTK